MWYLVTKSSSLANLTAGYNLLGKDYKHGYIYGYNQYSKRSYFRGFKSAPKLYKTKAAAKAQASRLLTKYVTDIDQLLDFTIDIVEIDQL